MAIAFQGTAAPLSSEGLAEVAGSLGIHAPEIWPVLAVETQGCEYLPDRRPQILYERHIIHRLTQGQFDDGDISDASPGGYGTSSAHQYERLGAAIDNDRVAALKSTSWGLGQIMGVNFAAAGLNGVEDMVTAMIASEDAQLAAMGNFLTATRLGPALLAHDWSTFARGYNGPNFAINRYDVRLNSESQKLSVGVLPDLNGLNVRAAQLYLTYHGFHPGPIDGMAGEKTMSALAEFQIENDLPQISTIDEGVVAQLRNTLPSTDPVPNAA